MMKRVTIFAICMGLLAVNANARELDFAHTESAQIVTPRIYGSSLFRSVTRDGAMGINADWKAGKRTDWFIETQSDGAELIFAGIVHSNSNWIDTGLLALKWGFEQQNSDGSFDCSDTYHSTSMFIEAAARSVLLLERHALSPLSQLRLDLIKRRLPLSMEWLMRPDKLDPYLAAVDKRLPLRYFLVGSALGQAGVAVGSPEAKRIGYDLMVAGFRRIAQDGHIPTKGGYDSAYQIVAVTRMLRYAENVGADAAWWSPVDRAYRWFLTRVTTNGGLVADGNTRVGTCKEKGRHGVYKKMSFRQPAFGVAFFDFVRNKRPFSTLADKILKRHQQIGGC
jgi:hypothetical protein